MTRLLASIEITGTRALSKERPRTGKSGHVYTPKRTQDYEQLIRATTLLQLPTSHRVATGPVRLEVQIWDEVPKSWVWSKKQAALNKIIYPQKGDLDNRVKAISDALNGVLYLDDKQIVQEEASMQYGIENSIIISVYSLDIEGQINEENN